VFAEARSHSDPTNLPLLGTAGHERRNYHDQRTIARQIPALAYCPERCVYTWGRRDTIRTIPLFTSVHSMNKKRQIHGRLLFECNKHMKLLLVGRNVYRPRIYVLLIQRVWIILPSQFVSTPMVNSHVPKTPKQFIILIQ
jgi:hypothetical protein